MKKIMLITSILLIGVANAGTYKWTDANGQTHYGDSPPVDQQVNELQIKSLEGSKTPPIATPSSAALSKTTQNGAEAGEIDECTLLKNKLEKYKKGLIDFSYEDTDGQKITPPQSKITKAYEQEIARACNGNGEQTEEPPSTTEKDPQ